MQDFFQLLDNTNVKASESDLRRGTTQIYKNIKVTNQKKKKKSCPCVRLKPYYIIN